ncbi:hypothetical protein GOBAR_AA23570 [Gossypium barbadense]|uniref:Uncharacterized protein n=1 Tax=Gossypium barbadense TaxID=3634 RepID=A0A2P5X186_GOSBA|nr:hypothetical protein GOBAR_AA23570 [Gossypium barbadense]
MIPNSSSSWYFNSANTNHRVMSNVPKGTAQAGCLFLTDVGYLVGSQPDYELAYLILTKSQGVAWVRPRRRSNQNPWAVDVSQLPQLEEWVRVSPADHLT